MSFALAMGTWDASPFGNDSACDFAGDLLRSGAPGLLEAVLRGAADAGDYLDADEGQPAVGAAEVVAAMGGDTSRLPVDLAAWASAQLPAGADLRQLALRALDRIMAPDSELMELWEEAGASEWQEEIEALRGRLA